MKNMTATEMTPEVLVVGWERNAYGRWIYRAPLTTPPNDPTPEQVRRERDRRAGRLSPPCLNAEHENTRRRLTHWTDRELTFFLHSRLVRLDPPPHERTCSCGSEYVPEVIR